MTTVSFSVLFPHLLNQAAAKCGVSHACVSSTVWRDGRGAGEVGPEGSLHTEEQCRPAVVLTQAECDGSRGSNTPTPSTKARNDTQTRRVVLS